MNILRRVFGKRTTTQTRVPKTTVLKTSKLRKGDQRMPRMRILNTQEQEDFDRLIKNCNYLLELSLSLAQVGQNNRRTEPGESHALH